MSNIINAAIPFMLLPILTRYMSPHEYGQVAMFQVLLSMLGAFVGLNCVGAAGRKYYDDNMSSIENKYFIASCLQIIVWSGICVFALIFFMRKYLASLLGLETNWILWAVLASSLVCVTQLRLGQWQVRKNARNYGMMQTFQSSIIVFLSLLLVIVYKEGVFGRIVSQMVGVCVAAIFSLYFLKKDNLFAFFVWNSRHAKEALAFGIPLIPHVAGGFLLISMDRLIIKVELGLADAGIYAVAAQLTMVMMLVFEAINKAYVPWLFEKLKQGHPADKRHIVRYTYAWFGAIMLGVVLAFLLGPSLITIIAGDQYSSAGELVGWLALGQGFVGMYLMVTNYIFYSKRTGLLSLVTISSGLLNVLLLFTFLRIFSLKGAAIAFSAAMGFRFFCTWWVAQRQYPMPWFNFNMK